MLGPAVWLAVLLSLTAPHAGQEVGNAEDLRAAFAVTSPREAGVPACLTSWSFSPEARGAGPAVTPPARGRARAGR